MRRDRRRLEEMKEWERATKGDHEEREGTSERERMGVILKKN